MYPLKVAKHTLTDWTAFSLDVQPLFWGTVQIGTTDLRVHLVTFHHTILKRWKTIKVSINLLHEKFDFYVLGFFFKMYIQNNVIEPNRVNLYGKGLNSNNITCIWYGHSFLKQHCCFMVTNCQLYSLEMQTGD